MENKKATLYCYEKILRVQFNNEEYLVNLMQGDLNDNWNGIIDQLGNLYDVNFHWDELDEENKPAFVMYSTYEEDGRIITEFAEYDVFDVEIVGSKETYFSN